MSGSGSRAGDEINLEEFERRLRAAGAQQARAEDPLAELSRLVEFSHFGIANGGTPPRAGEPGRTGADSAPPIENASLRSTIDEQVEELAPGASEADRAARQDYEFDAQRSEGAFAADADEERRPMRWKLAVSALAVAGVAMIGAVFALKGAVPGMPTKPPFIAAAQGPVKVAPPKSEKDSFSGDPGGTLLGSAKPGPVKLVNSEEQPIDLTAEGALANQPSAAANPPAASNSATLADAESTPLVAPPGPPPPAISSEFPDPKPVRTVSLRPDGTPIALANPPEQAPSDAKPAPAPAPAPSAPAANTASEAAGALQPSTPKLDLPARPEKSPARVVVAKTDTTAPAPTAETPNETPPARASARPERARKPKEVADATAEPPVDATPATTSGGWSVQLAAPRSEREANSELARLTSKYAAELNGSAIGVHKAVVRGRTIYRLRVVGLTKADAAKLCARVKGDGGQCFIAR